MDFLVRSKNFVAISEAFITNKCYKVTGKAAVSFWMADETVEIGRVSCDASTITIIFSIFPGRNIFWITTFMSALIAE
jgi:hypothetical protein